MSMAYIQLVYRARKLLYSASLLSQTDWDTSSEDEAELQKRKRELLRKLRASAQQDDDS